MNKLYLLIYNEPNAALSRGAIHDFIKALPESVITDWWHYIPTAYIIASPQPVNELYNAIFPMVPEQNLLIVEINPKNAQGWLPSKAWDWLRKYE